MSPAGRPPLAGERKLDQVRVRLTSDEKATLDAAAQACGKLTGTWLREVGLSAAAEIAAAAPKKKTAKKKS